jgi:GTP-binding protein
LIVHVVDAGSVDPLGDLSVVEAELAAYGHGLMDLPRIVALNKLDLAEAREAESTLREALGDRTVVAISAATGEGVAELNKRLFAAVAPRAAVESTVAPRRITLERAGGEWAIEREDGAYRVRGMRIEQLASGIDWSDPDASAYFQRLLTRNGVDRELRARGVKDGDTVRIGGLELEWREAPV